MQLTPENEKKFEDLKSVYPTKMALTLPLLRLLQEQEGRLHDEALDFVAAQLEEPPMQVRAVASYYSLFHEKSIGKHHIQICTNVACRLFGAETLMEHLVKKLGVHSGDTTIDGLFSLAEVECIGACGTAPAMMINDTYYENLTLEKIDALLESLK